MDLVCKKNKYIILKANSTHKNNPHKLFMPLNEECFINKFKVEVDKK